VLHDVLQCINSIVMQCNAPLHDVKSNGLGLLWRWPCFYLCCFRLQSAAVSWSVMQNDKSMFSIQWTLGWPGSTWCPSACRLTPAVEVRSPSRQSSSLLEAGRGQSIFCRTAWLTGESSYLISIFTYFWQNIEYCFIFNLTIKAR